MHRFKILHGWALSRGVVQWNYLHCERAAGLLMLPILTADSVSYLHSARDESIFMKALFVLAIGYIATT